MRKTTLGWWVPLGLGALMSFAATTSAEEVVARVDSLDPNTLGWVQAGFDPGEEGAVWLTSPCTGDIVALQVYWRSLTGTTQPSIEDSITVYQSGPYPVPGAIMLNDVPPYDPAVLVGPVVNDTAMNEFRYMDENNSIPIRIPVAQGQEFVVSFKFYNDPDEAIGPSLVTDFDGCQSGKTAIKAQGAGWINPCLLGMSGDLVIRAVIDCPGETGACCHATGMCTEDVELEDCEAFGDVWHEQQSCSEITCVARGACCVGSGCFTLIDEASCVAADGVYAGDGSNCDDAVCVPGACCSADTGECVLSLQVECNGLGGDFLGPGTACEPDNPCPQPVGACCLNDGAACFPNQYEADCLAANGEWHGPDSTCADDNGNGTADVCEAPVGCPGDCDCDGDRDYFDIAYLVESLQGETAWAAYYEAQQGVPPTCDYLEHCDIDQNGEVDYFDINPFLDVLGAPCP